MMQNHLLLASSKRVLALILEEIAIDNQVAVLMMIMMIMMIMIMMIMIMMIMIMMIMMFAVDNFMAVVI